jgi:gliding motility-associated-like protein
MLVYDDGRLTDTFRSWVFHDEVKIDSIKHVQNCDYLTFTVYPSSGGRFFSTYYYFDFCNPDDVMERIISNTFTVAWDADADIYAGATGISQAWKTATGYTNSLRAPFAEASYTATITNVFGNRSKEYKTQRIQPMGVYAAFDILKADRSGIFSPTTDLKGEALWRMKLDNKSLNADKYRWIGLNNQNVNFLVNDTLWRFDTEDVIEEIVYKPGRYPVRLTAENTLTGCSAVSTVTGSDGGVRDCIIEVSPSEFAPESLPNAFTPNGDGNNDVFTFVKTKRPVSMNAMELKIINRNGQLVYKYSGAVADWEGWNGKVNGSGSECSSGVYYYIISGDGWDDKTYDGKRYTGFVHLFRNN